MQPFAQQKYETKWEYKTGHDQDQGHFKSVHLSLLYYSEHSVRQPHMGSKLGHRPNFN